MDGRKFLERIAAALGIAGLFVVLPFYISSGLAAPLWAIVLLLAFWLTLLVLAIRWFTLRPWWILGFPFLAAAVWFLTITLGEQVLGWQA
ncbi:hypothetical protein N802_00395 [Knoellia sinensis KCTC 19936]|uniref:Apolipoprotein N-acyltransferase n=1 Tax=Knoellia sinensis KCTC 19936 TaxID=1385520 RepID=A0A0A0JC85_9MICO|nr:hypothetical protein [Knoellia sinensis]KGN34985.1 hypothetical protein N802_00395 [Knoellia sinensis KCTC 19936]